LDQWDTSGTGLGISVTVYAINSDGDPENVTVVVRRKSGTDDSQSAQIKQGQSLHQFDFPSIDKANVVQVLASGDALHRCFVQSFPT